MVRKGGGGGEAGALQVRRPGTAGTRRISQGFCFFSTQRLVHVVQHHAGFSHQDHREHPGARGAADLALGDHA